MAKILCRLDGTNRLAVLRERAGRRHAELLYKVLGALTKRGLVEDATGTRGPADQCELTPLALSARIPSQLVSARAAHSTVVVQGEGRLMVALATLLATSGIGHVVIQSKGVVTPHDVGTGYALTDVGLRRQNVAIDAVRRANPATSTSVLPDNRTPDLVVLTDSVVPSPETVRTLMCERIPHLPVRMRDGIGVVGPLVLPNRSGCLHCADLHRSARDRCWPRVANQLADTVQPADPASTHATAAFAAGQILHIACRPEARSPLIDTTIELDVYAGTARRRTWPPHPRCECVIGHH